ncbi:MAG: GNAT family N-acetyltransferase [Rhodobacteraceae bacterium]|nr:GNAT family N-acetyltransferase [Paracoccaceae bacterium]
MIPAEMAALHARCFTTPRPWTELEFAGFLADPGVFAAFDPAGFALGRVVADEAELLTLAVAPEHRRQGRARSLLTALEGDAARRGAATLFLEVAADNDPAIRLYRAASYREVGRRRFYYRREGAPPVDALVMSKAL